MSYAFWRKLDTLIIIWTYNARESDGKHFATWLQMSQHPSQKQSILKLSLIFLWTTKINGKKGKDRGNQYVWPSCLYKYIIYIPLLNQPIESGSCISGCYPLVTCTHSQPIQDQNVKEPRYLPRDCCRCWLVPEHICLGGCKFVATHAISHNPQNKSMYDRINLFHKK